MKKISKRTVVLSIIAIVSLLIVYRAILNKIGIEYTRGKTPGSFLASFSGNQLIYKDDVLFEGNYENRGLYIKDISTDYQSEDDILLSDDFNMCINTYGDWVYFIDNEYNLLKVEKNGLNEECVIRGGGKYIYDTLIINDTMYLTRDNEFNEVSLYAMELSKNKLVEIEEGVNYKYLYDYCGFACIISNDNERIIIYDHQSGEKQIFKNLPTEIQGFLLNGEIIHYNDSRVYKRDNFKIDKDEILVEMDNISRIIIQYDDMVIATLNQYGLIQIHEYNFKKKTLKMIANANHLPRDYNDEFIACFSDSGFGNVELIDRLSGKIKTFSFK